MPDADPNASHSVNLHKEFEVEDNHHDVVADGHIFHDNVAVNEYLLEDTIDAFVDGSVKEQANAFDVVDPHPEGVLGAVIDLEV